MPRRRPVPNGSTVVLLAEKDQQLAELRKLLHDAYADPDQDEPLELITRHDLISDDIRRMESYCSTGEQINGGTD